MNILLVYFRPHSLTNTHIYIYMDGKTDWSVRLGMVKSFWVLFRDSLHFVASRVELCLFYMCLFKPSFIRVGDNKFTDNNPQIHHMPSLGNYFDCNYEERRVKKIRASTLSC